MNQIIQESLNNINKDKHISADNKKFYIEFSNEIAEIPYGENFNILSNHNKNQKFQSIKMFIKKRKYQLQFILSTIIAIVFLFFFFFKLYQNHQQEKIAKGLLNNYQLTTLYSTNSQYESSKTNITVEKPFVIGMIKIDKIGLSYPILSETNDELLKISLCRFAGPVPNEKGNLCIVGHNYLDNRFFSRLDEMNIGDVVEIYGLSGVKQEYHVFQKYEVDADNLSCTNQDIGDNKIITLLTCDNLDVDKRLVIQAK